MNDQVSSHHMTQLVSPKQQPPFILTAGSGSESSTQMMNQLNSYLQKGPRHNFVQEASQEWNPYQEKQQYT